MIADVHKLQQKEELFINYSSNSSKLIIFSRLEGKLLPYYFINNIDRDSYQISEDKKKILFFINKDEFNYSIYFLNGDNGSITYLFDTSKKNLMSDKNMNFILIPIILENDSYLELYDIYEKKVKQKIKWDIDFPEIIFNRNFGWYDVTIYRCFEDLFDFEICINYDSLLVCKILYSIKDNKFFKLIDFSSKSQSEYIDFPKYTRKNLGLQD